MNKKKEAIFKKARLAALDSDFHRQHVGCVITYKGMPISTGSCSEKTHPYQKIYNEYRHRKPPDDNEWMPKVHAEISALSKIKDLNLNPKKLAVYTYRIRKDQQFGMARPCPACINAIIDMGIKHIYYSTNDGYAHEILNLKI